MPLNLAHDIYIGLYSGTSYNPLIHWAWKTISVFYTCYDTFQNKVEVNDILSGWYKKGQSLFEPCPRCHIYD